MKALSNDLVYCHGLPGSSEELNFLDRDELERLHVIGPQYGMETDELVNSESSRSLHLIGFSLGAMTAIKIAAQHENAVGMLSLISAAAPLELGDFLPGMAGEFVFQTASRSATRFRMLTALQRGATRLSSNLAINAMFRGSPESEIALLEDPNFRKSLEVGLRKSYGEYNVNYRRAIHEYVQPWADYLGIIQCPVRIYHGAADNWAPVEMAHALKEEIYSRVEIIEYPGLGHYSTLRKALPISMESRSVV